MLISVLTQYDFWVNKSHLRLRQILMKMIVRIRLWAIGKALKLQETPDKQAFHSTFIYCFLQLLEISNLGGKQALRALSGTNLLSFTKLMRLAQNNYNIDSASSKKLYFFCVRYDIFMTLRIKLLKNLNKDELNQELYSQYYHHLIENHSNPGYVNFLIDVDDLFQLNNILSALSKLFNSETASSLWRHGLDVTNQLYSRGRVRSAEEFIYSLKLICDKKRNELPGLRRESSYFTAIGHLALLEFLIKGQKIGLIGKENFEFLYDLNLISNLRLAEYLKENLESNGVKITNNLIEREGNLELLPIHGVNYAPLRRVMGKIQNTWEEQEKSALVISGLPKDMEQKARKILENNNVSANQPFVGLHIRDNQDPWRLARNSEVEKLSGGISILNESKLSVIRIGNNSKSTSQVLNEKPNADLTKIRLDREDMELVQWFVWSQCEFFIGNLSGGTHPPSLFGKRTLWFDFFPINHFRPPNSFDIIVPKRLYKIDTGKLLTFREMLSLEGEITQIENTIRLLELGLTLVDTDNQLLSESLTEMLNSADSLKSTSRSQEKVKNIYSEFGFPFGGNISDAFLNRFPEFLD